MRKRFVSESNSSVRLYGRFTWKELVRLVLPIALLTWFTGPGTLWTALIAIGIGAILGMAWYTIRPNGDPLEVHLLHKARWTLRGDRP